MPLAAVVQNRVLCVHGGIGPRFRSLADLRGVRRPLRNFQKTAVEDAMWSDPCDTVEVFAASRRGAGCLFGARPLAAFLAAENFELVVRGHQCVPGGVEWSLGRRCLTVFSASTYGGGDDNLGAALALDGEHVDVTVLERIPVLTRDEVRFTHITSERPEDAPRALVHGLAGHRQLSGGPAVGGSGRHIAFNQRATRGATVRPRPAACGKPTPVPATLMKTWFEI